MKLKQYLNEKIVLDDDEAKKIISAIENDCQPFLKQMKASNFLKNELLFSGRHTTNRFEKKKVRKNRKPKDTPLKIHKGVDDGFYDKFGVRARSNAVFCTGDRNTALGYGEPHIVFPIGKFEVIGSHQLRDLYNSAEMDTGLENWAEDFLQFDAKSYKKGNLQKALNSENEIMLHCKEYYILKTVGIDKILNHFKDTLK